MIKVVSGKMKSEIHIDSISENLDDYEYGIWAIGKPGRYDPNKVLLLVQVLPPDGKTFYYFSKLNGTHGGWSNHTTIKDCIRTVMDDFDILIPENKGEIINKLSESKIV